MSNAIVIIYTDDLPCIVWNEQNCPLKEKSYRGEWVHCPECGILIEDERENIEL